MTPSLPPSRPSSPSSRFTPQNSTAEDLLKAQTVGLVHLSDFRKRRAEALEQKEREATGSSLGRFTPSSRSGAVTPSDGASTPPQLPVKKKRKNPPKGKLSFGVDDEEQDHSSQPSKATSPNPSSPGTDSLEQPSPPPSTAALPKRRLGPNSSLPLAPKALTKSALLRDAQTRESLRKEFLVLQESIKATEILIPFVFYDGTNIPGGVCKVKKGDHIWVFLDRSRKVGAELGVGGSGGEKASVRREWARVGVDDLMLVRGEIIVPHVSIPLVQCGKRELTVKQHYDFYYFIINKTLGPTSTPLFDYSAQPPVSAEVSSHDPLTVPSRKNNGAVTPADARLEGYSYSDDPNLTKVVDRRWYERNKHIFPASVWEEFDPAKDYTRGMRRDAEGNAFFFT
ncbi:hypothetical protein MMC11_006581 [Xylographa trunciseda]|nr:hypothetical protein [Xylographa trunciseda]